MSISPSLSSWRCAAPFSGNWRPWRHSVRLELLVPGPQRRGHGLEVGIGGRLLQHLRVGGQVDQRLLQEGGAQEVADAGVRQPAGVLLRPVQQRRRRARHGCRVADARRVVDEDDLRHAPGHRQAVHRRGEVDHVGALLRGVDVAEVGQRLRHRAEQQALLLHVQQVRAVDPDEVDAAVAVAAGGLLGDHAGHGLGRVLQAHVLHADAVFRLHLLAHPGDEGVGLLVAGPGVPEHRLAARLGDDLLPGGQRLRLQQRGGATARPRPGQRAGGIGVVAWLSVFRGAQFD